MDDVEHGLQHVHAQHRLGDVVEQAVQRRVVDLDVLAAMAAGRGQQVVAQGHDGIVEAVGIDAEAFQDRAVVQRFHLGWGQVAVHDHRQCQQAADGVGTIGGTESHGVLTRLLLMHPA